MSFKTEHKNYKGYQSDVYFVSELPSGFSSPLQGFIIRYAGENYSLSAIVNDIAAIIPTSPTTNWSHNYLLDDLSNNVGRLCKLALPKTMDFLKRLYVDYGVPVDDVNEFLEDQNIGYVLSDDGFMGAVWELRENVSSRGEVIESAAEHVKDICAQTLSHLEQAVDHLLNTKNDRDRKDAIRDCMSAMEAMLKSLTGADEIGKATKALREAKVWGADAIVKDGLSLWNHLHQTYPDVRHGNPNASALSDEEALYWADRIMCFIRYMGRMHKKIDAR